MNISIKDKRDALNEKPFPHSPSQLDMLSREFRLYPTASKSKQEMFL